MTQRILHVIPSLDRAGAEKQMSLLVRGLPRAAFDVHGDVLSPPAPRALDLYEIRIENRVVKVNIANQQQRSAFSAAQVTYA